MKTSPTKFRESLKMDLQVLLWRQWRTLGIAAYSPETKRPIDLEALILATSVRAEHDKRLWESVIQWLIGFQDWVNKARLKRMSTVFLEPDEFLKQPLLKKKIWKEVEQALLPTVFSNKVNKITSRANRTLTPPLMKKPPLLQLYLRSIFGINARAELILYLLAKGEGNSNQIAKEIYYDQKNVYIILEHWAESGFVTKESRGKQNLYSLESGKNYLPENLPHYTYWSWTLFFQFYSRLLVAVSTPPWINDSYLLSSLFRDVYPQAIRIAKENHISLPDPNLSLGENYFAPMSQKLFDLLNSLL